MTDLAVLLLEWYDKHHQVLPWRDNPTPYSTWVSEIMLQQTRVDTVKDRYIEFLSTFPTIKALAEADLERVLKLWEGLGYYSRARNLHKGAYFVKKEYNGVLPKDPAELKKIPGVGEYTAKAISSIAYQQPYVCVDGNLLRIFSRLTTYKTPIKSPSAKRDCEHFLLPIQPKERPGDFNQALMDLGEMVCLPNGEPLCSSCPLSGFCAAHASRNETHYPKTGKQKEKPITEITVFRIACGNQVAIRKRPTNGLLAGLYELPNKEGKMDINDVRNEFPEAKEIRSGKTHKHVFTHRIWLMKEYYIIFDNKPNIANAIWATKKDLEEMYALPTAFKVFVD